MQVVVLLLLVAGLALLVLGLIAGSTPLVVGSIAASLLAALAIFRYRDRSAAGAVKSSSQPPATPARDGTEAQSTTSARVPGAGSAGGVAPHTAPAAHAAAEPAGAAVADPAGAAARLNAAAAAEPAHAAEPDAPGKPAAGAAGPAHAAEPDAPGEPAAGAAGPAHATELAPTTGPAHAAAEHDPAPAIDAEVPTEATEPAEAAEPAEADTDPPLRSRGDEPVQVIDGRPRYHLASCTFLLGRDPVPVPLRQAVEDGFTPCALCDPDSGLAAR